jgi:hypothetical protein
MIVYKLRQVFSEELVYPNMKQVKLPSYRMVIEDGPPSPSTTFLQSTDSKLTKSEVSSFLEEKILLQGGSLSHRDRSHLPK